MNKASRNFEILPSLLIGEGSRRCCYQVPGKALCVKFYRDPSTLPVQTKPSVRLHILAARFVGWLNINTQEWRYHRELLQRLPAELAAVFPESIEPVYSAERGWGIVESLIANPDGTPSQHLSDELSKITDPGLRKAVYEAAVSLFDQLIEHAVCFFDVSSILVQWTGANTFRLRIADIEPQGRAFIPGLSRVRPYVRRKVLRRSSRFRATVRKQAFATGERCDLQETNKERGFSFQDSLCRVFGQFAGLF